MKLGKVRDGLIYCTDGLRIGTWRADRGFQPRGTFPNPNTLGRRLIRDAVNLRSTKRLLRPITGSYTLANVFPLRDDHLIGTTANWIFASTDGGRSMTPVRQLPASSGPMGVHPTSVCQVDGKTYLAEYPLGEDDARVLVSDDYGWTWSTFVERSDVRHFHAISLDPYTDQLWGTTGDTDEESAIGTFANGEFEPIGRGSQRWRAVSLIFTPKFVLWGMDCPYADEIAIFRLARDDLDNDIIDPDVVTTTDSAVLYADTLTIGDDLWTVVTTGSAAGVDSTAPPDRKHNRDSRTARVLASSSDSEFETWYQLGAFDRRRTVSEHTRQIPTSSAYVFLAGDPELGFVINPYNTRTRHGEFIRIAPSAFEASELPPYAEEHRAEPCSITLS